MALEQEIKQKQFKSIYQKVLLNLLYTSDKLSHEIALLLKGFGLTTAQYNVLRILAGSDPNALTPGEIKSVMISKRSDLTRLIDRMETKGIVSRMSCPENRRQVNISISKAGHELLKQIAPHIESNFDNHLSNKLTQSEAESLSNLLDKIRG